MPYLFKSYNNKNSVILAQRWADRPQKQKLNSINRPMYKVVTEFMTKFSLKHSRETTLFTINHI